MGRGEGWKATTLGAELERIEGGGTPSRKVEAYWDGEIPWATVKDLTAPRLDDTEEHISESGLKNSSSRVVPAGTVITATRMAVGKTAKFSRDVAINQDLKALFPKQSLDRDFLFHWLQSKRPAIEAVATGSTVKGVRIDTLRALELLLPPKSDQRRIVEILDSVDEAIQATRAVIEQTRKVKQGMLQELLTRGIGHTRFKQTEIGEVPEGWEVAELGNVCERVSVGIASAATHAYADRGVPLIRNQNIRQGFLDTSELIYVTPEFDQQNQTKRIKTRDVLTIRTGYPGVSAVVPSEYDGCQSFTTLVSRPRPDVLNSEYLCAWINSTRGKKFVRAGQAGGAQQNLNARMLQRMLVPIPPLQEQTAIAGQASEIITLLRRYEEDLVVLQRSKKGLVEVLLTGAVRNTPSRSTRTLMEVL